MTHRLSLRVSCRPARLRARGAASASAAAMRVCQPGPLAFQRASVRGAMRRLMETFASGDFGRPRGFNNRAAASLPTSFGSTSAAGRARLKSAAVHSGFSSPINSGLSLRSFIMPYLSVVGLTQTDDMNALSAGREHQHVQPVIDEAERLKTPLTVVPAHVLIDQGVAPLELHRPRERKSTQGDIPPVLGGIETDVHQLNVYAYIRKIKPGFDGASARRKLADQGNRGVKSHNPGRERTR